MKRKWQQFLPSAVQLHLNGTDGKHEHTHTPSFSLYATQVCLFSFFIYFFLFLLVSYFLYLWPHECVYIPAELVAAVRYFDQRQAQAQQQTQDQSEEVRDKLAFLELQAQVRSVKSITMSNLITWMCVFVLFCYLDFYRSSKYILIVSGKKKTKQNQKKPLRREECVFR